MILTEYGLDRYPGFTNPALRHSSEVSQKTKSALALVGQYAPELSLETEGDGEKEPWFM